MKITINQLRSLIKEEVRKVNEIHGFGRESHYYGDQIHEDPGAVMVLISSGHKPLLNWGEDSNVPLSGAALNNAITILGTRGLNIDYYMDSNDGYSEVEVRMEFHSKEEKDEWLSTAGRQRRKGRFEIIRQHSFDPIRY
jgi:hypothetical protein